MDRTERPEDTKVTRTAGQHQSEQNAAQERHTTPEEQARGAVRETPGQASRDTPIQRQPVTARGDRGVVQRGVVAPIGGAEDKKRQRHILARFAELCGGARGHIAIIPTASRLSDTGDVYRKLFAELGVGATTVLSITERRHCEDPRWLEALASATGVFFTGGDQLLLSTVLGGTTLARTIAERNAAGCHVAGTSAGAAFLSAHMIAFGSSGATPRFGNVTLAPGLGLTDRLVVDQHFRQRDRLGRLLSALSYNPAPLGMGLDEDTAAFIGPDDVIEIHGTGAITIVDLADLEYSAMADTEPGAPVDLVGVRLHVLSAGARYDLAHRKALPAIRRLLVEEE